MTTKILITVDTELSAGRQARGLDVRANFASSILGKCSIGEFGIRWQMDRLENSGLTAVFFVDPMPALVHGDQIIADIVGPIVTRGHEVQLHLHTEWLEWVAQSPVGGRLGHNLADFTLDDQIVLLGLARDLLIRAGAPPPIAFRAGNFGADDNTLRALSTLGITWDASANLADRAGNCRIPIASDQVGAVIRHDVVVVPVSGLHDRQNQVRPAQICAISGHEMRAALRHAALAAHPLFMLVTHSFEMLSRDRMRPNKSVIARFNTLCRTIENDPSLAACGFGSLDPNDLVDTRKPLQRLSPNLLRTGCRIFEQVLSTWRYEHRLLPL